MLKLYYAPGACSTASHIGLEESGAKYDSQALSFASNEQKTPEYLKINPRGRVPALVIDEGTIVENTAILDYVATRYAPALMPSDPVQRARAISLMAWFSNNVHPSFTHISRPERFATDSAVFDHLKATGRNNFHAALKEIDDAELVAQDPRLAGAAGGATRPRAREERPGRCLTAHVNALKPRSCDRASRALGFPAA